MITRVGILIVGLTFSQIATACADSKGIDKVPPAEFQGDWQVEKVTWKRPDEHKPNADKITEEGVIKGRIDRIYFRRHESGALQQFAPSTEPGEASWSRGITVLELTKNTLKYRLWSEHPNMYRQITLNPDGSAVLTIYWPKEIETHYLKRNKGEQVSGGNGGSRR